MKRILAGAGWFLVLETAMLMVGGAIVGGAAGGQAHGFGEGYDAGHAAGQAFGEQFGGSVFAAALIVAAVGTWRRALPGTR